MRKLLLTGASGFVGRQCLPTLAARGWQVHAVTSRPAPANQGVAHWYQVDLLDTQAVDALVAAVRPDALLHLAWYTQHGRYWTSIENIRWVQAGLALMRAFHAQGGTRIVMAGTCAEYDWRYGFCSEDVTPRAPQSLYGVCKHALELMTMGFARQAGLSAAWGRIFQVYGPFESPLRIVPATVTSALRGQPVRCTNGEQARDFLHVADAADAFASLVDSATSGAVNIGSGQATTIRAVIEKIVRLVGRDTPIEWGAVAMRPDDPPLLVADVRRLRDEIGFRPRYELDTGLAATIEWWRDAIDH